MGKQHRKPNTKATAHTHNAKHRADTSPTTLLRPKANIMSCSERTEKHECEIIRYAFALTNIDDNFRCVVARTCEAAVSGHGVCVGQAAVSGRARCVSAHNVHPKEKQIHPKTGVKTQRNKYILNTRSNGL